MNLRLVEGQDFQRSYYFESPPIGSFLNRVPELCNEKPQNSSVNTEKLNRYTYFKCNDEFMNRCATLDITVFLN